MTDEESAIWRLERCDERDIACLKPGDLRWMVGALGPGESTDPVHLDWQTAADLLDDVDDWTIGSEGRATLWYDGETAEADGAGLDEPTDQRHRTTVAIFRAYLILVQRNGGLA
jgi:hypothetical protein